MKKLSITILCALCVLGVSLSAQSQTIATNTNTVTTPTQTFFASVGDYFTTSNTNFDFHSYAEISLGAAYQSGINFASDFGIRGKLDCGTNWGVLVESVTRNAGIDGVIVSEQAGLGLYYIKHDIELAAGIDAGYRFDADTPAVTAYLDVRKLLTENTFAGLRLAYESDFSSRSPSAPVLTFETGFKF